MLTEKAVDLSEGATDNGPSESAVKENELTVEQQEMVPIPPAEENSENSAVTENQQVRGIIYLYILGCYSLTGHLLKHPISFALKSPNNAGNVYNFYAGHPQQKTLFTNYYGSSVIADNAWPYYCRLLLQCNLAKQSNQTSNNKQLKVNKVTFSSTVVLSLVVSRQSVWWLECSQPCLHQLYVLSTAFS